MQTFLLLYFCFGIITIPATVFGLIELADYLQEKL
jgi:hypothetical protein